MLQRSPSYFYAPPATHELAVTLRALDIPEEWTHEILRRQYISQQNWLALDIAGSARRAARVPHGVHAPAAARGL